VNEAQAQQQRNAESRESDAMAGGQVTGNVLAQSLKKNS